MQISGAYYVHKSTFEAEGWYWMPEEGEPVGPFSTEEEALEAGKGTMGY